MSQPALSLNSHPNAEEEGLVTLTFHLYAECAIIHARVKSTRRKVDLSDIANYL